MSLWTPDGEHTVPRSEPAAAEPGPGPDRPLTAEEQAQAEAMAHELSEARARLLETDVSTVIANHALGIYELAAIHLTADEPRFDQAALAIDALNALVTSLSGRLGDAEPTLREALQQLQMAFVQRSTATGGPDADQAHPGGADPGGPAATA
ncbi:MAG: hypothetical protein ACK5RL_14310 [Acidimicrobiales bacterium]